MSEFGTLVVLEFIKNERESLSKIEERLRNEPMTTDQRVNLIEEVLKTGISFGIKKGIFLEDIRRSTIDHVKAKQFQRCVDEIFFDINDDIMKFKNQPRIKYSKRKYKSRKSTVQLSMLSQLGYDTEPV